jgi:hypothetical protein
MDQTLPPQQVQWLKWERKQTRRKQLVGAPAAALVVSILYYWK